MKQFIVFIKDGKIIGYWDKYERSIRCGTLCLLDPSEIEYEYERAIFHIRMTHKEIIFPVIVPFGHTIETITDDLRSTSKILYDKIHREHWPVKS